MTDTFDPVAHALELTSAPQDQSGGPAPGAFDAVSHAIQILNGENPPAAPDYSPEYTGMEKFGASAIKGLQDTAYYGPKELLLNLAKHFESDPEGPYHKKAQEIADEIAERQKTFAPATNSGAGLLGTMASKLPLAVVSGAAQIPLWAAEGALQPGTTGERLAGAASNVLTAGLAGGANKVANKTVNATLENWSPEMATAAAKDADLAAAGLQGTYSAYKAPNPMMQQFHNFMTAGGTSNNALVDNLKTVAQGTQDKSKALWTKVGDMATAAGNPTVDASGTASAVKGFIDSHGVDALKAGAPDIPTAARLVVLGKPQLADEAVRMLVGGGRTQQEAVDMVNGFLTQGSNLPFTDFRQVQQGIGAMSNNLRRSSSASSQAESAAHKAYSSTFDDLQSLLTNPQTAQSKNWSPDLLQSLDEARNYSRTTAFPWETGRVRTPQGAEVKLPIISQLAAGKYDVDPTSVVKDVLNNKNNAMLANYYGSVFDPSTQRLINGIQADSARASAWARGQKEFAAQPDATGIVQRAKAAVMSGLDRNPTYKHFMFASPDVVPGPGVIPALNQVGNIGVRAGLQALSPQIGLGSAVLATEIPGALGEIRDYVKGRLLGH